MKPVRIGHLSTIYHTAVILMGTDWITKSTGVTVEWKLFGAGPAIIDAFERGEIDLAYAGLTPVIIGVSKGLGIKCIAGGHIEGAIFIAGKDFKASQQTPNINEVLVQFKGKTIGTTLNGSMPDVIIRHYIDKSGLEDSVAVKNYPWADLIVEAMTKKKVEAAVATLPLAVIAAHAFGAKIVIPPHILWPNSPSYGIVTSIGFARDNFEIVEEFLRLHEDANNLIRTDPLTAAKMASRVVGVVDEGFVVEVYKISPKYCASISEDFIESTMAFVPILHRLGYISKSMDAKDIFDLRFIKKIHPEPPHY